MTNLDLTNVDPRVVARLAELEAAVKSSGVNPSQLLPTAANGLGGFNQPMLSAQPTHIPGRGPVSMPMAAPGPGGGSYNRYREMTIEELLLENRVVFLVGEINHASAYRVIMHLLYLQSVK